MLCDMACPAGWLTCIPIYLPTRICNMQTDYAGKSASRTRREVMNNCRSSIHGQSWIGSQFLVARLLTCRYCTWYVLYLHVYAYQSRPRMRWRLRDGEAGHSLVDRSSGKEGDDMTTMMERNERERTRRCLSSEIRMRV